MKPGAPSRRDCLLALSGSALFGSALFGCAGVPMSATQSPVAATNRIGWGATKAQIDGAQQLGWPAYVEQQLHADSSKPLHPTVQPRIDALDISKRLPLERLLEMQALARARGVGTEAERATARRAYQVALRQALDEARQRHTLRALYSEQQLLEHLSWFWYNHFSVHQGKGNIFVLLPDYEDHALRAHALGSFRALLGAVVRHPAMLRYLDNVQNAAGRINENLARELLELHTLGVDGGYRQQDVTEMARLLTGFSVRMEPGPPNLPPKWQAQYQRDGLFEFNPARHDFGPKLILGHTIRGSGAAELDEALDLLVAHPSTARFISRKLAVFLLADDPPGPLVDAMARAFQASGGDIKATLRPLLLSAEFTAPAPRKFKDPMHYVLSAVRVGFEGHDVRNTQPVTAWLRELGQGLYDRTTPDGYPDRAEAWNSAGQMSTRFEVARQMAGAAAVLGQEPGRPAPTTGAPPLRAEQALLRERVEPTLGLRTRAALQEAETPQGWLALLFSSPEFMLR